jgi:peptide/nickel transport system ATP-binding protein
MSTPLLEIRDLRVHFVMDEGTVKAVEGVNLTIGQGRTIGLVGESGCGKSVTAFSVLQIVGKPGRIVGGEILFHRPLGQDKADAQVTKIIDIAKLNPRGREMRAIRGAEIAMIFQEPMTSLSMMHTVGFQIIEAITLHQKVTARQAREQAISMLGRVGIPKPEQRVDSYPFELSGGMRQRAMIAMALVCNPRLLIADEPTTALDVTTQAQIMELIKELQGDMGMSVMLITHDLGIIAEACNDVVVMYLGEVMERADVKSLFRDPLHPYTRALLRSIPRLGHGRSWQLEPIEGAVPDPYNRPEGCPFHPRCADFIPGQCDTIHPPMLELADGRAVRCLRYGSKE